MAGCGLALMLSPARSALSRAGSSACVGQSPRFSSRNERLAVIVGQPRTASFGSRLGLGSSTFAVGLCPGRGLAVHGAEDVRELQAGLGGAAACVGQ